MGPTHHWGDDYAQYIREALNLVNGIPFYESSYIYNPLNPEYAPPNYPPGFPLLLAPVVAITGTAIQPMLYLISILLVALLFILYAYYQKHMGLIAAACLSVLSVYCGAVMDLKSHVLSDLPLLVFVSLYFLFREKDQNPAKFELYDLRDELQKRVMIEEVKPIQNRQTITRLAIEDLQQKLKVKVETRKIEYDRGLSDSLFTEERLKSFINDAVHRLDQK